MTFRLPYSLKKPLVTCTILIFSIILVQWFAASPGLVETYYSSWFYVHFSKLMRSLTGWLPISLGDLIYSIIGFHVLTKLYGAMRFFFKTNAKGQFLLRGTIKAVNIALIFYFIFYVFWGLNYSRDNLSKRFGFKYHVAQQEELVQFDNWLIGQANQSKHAIDSMHLFPLDFDEMVAKSKSSYFKAAAKEPTLRYYNLSLKPSIFGFAGDYLGFTGYYNPFTGEAQINTGAPFQIQPFICCHEMAHQIGYAKENEANFAAFLVCSQSDDPRFRYAAFLELFQYTHGQLQQKDTALARELLGQMSPAVKHDLKLMQEHYESYENAVEPWISAMYSLFLMSNRQPDGIRTYGNVVSLVISYRKSRGL